MLRRYLVLAMLGLAPACGGGDALGPTTTATLAGAYSATRIEVANASDPQDVVDFIAQFGMYDSLEIRADGSFYEALGDGSNRNVDSGAVTINGARISFAYFGTSTTFEAGFTLSHGILTLTWTGDDWDFDGDGSLDPSNWTEVFRRH